jgi:hypothetical protein
VTETSCIQTSVIGQQTIQVLRYLGNSGTSVDQGKADNNNLWAFMDLKRGLQIAIVLGLPVHFRTPVAREGGYYHVVSAWDPGPSIGEPFPIE